jgi:streptogramin lyase
VGLGPNGTTAAFGSIWVANHHDGSVSRLDPRTGKTVAVIQTGGGPGYVAAGYGSIWMTDFFSNQIARIDPRTNKATRIVLGPTHGPGDTGCAPIPGFGSIWVGSDADVLRLDPASGKVIARVPIAKPDAGGADLPCMIQEAQGLMWTHAPNSHIEGIDPATNRVAKNLNYSNIVDGFGTTWVVRAGLLDGHVVRLDPAGGNVKPIHIVQGTPTDILLTLSPGRLWIMDNATDKLLEADARSGEILQTVNTGGLVGQPTFADGGIWLPVFDANAVWRVT